MATAVLVLLQCFMSSHCAYLLANGFKILAQLKIGLWFQLYYSYGYVLHFFLFVITKLLYIVICEKHIFGLVAVSLK